MSEPIPQRSESIQTTGQSTGVMAGAALAESRPVIVRMLTQDDLPYDDNDMSEHLKYLRMPTQDDLPYFDGEPLESELHLYQIMLFIETLKLYWADRDDFFVGGNMAIYFSAEHVKNKDFRGPDFFVALGVDGTRKRKSWVVWEERRTPDLVMEFLSDRTATFDRGRKKEIYQDEMRVPEYFYYDPWTGELAGFAMRGHGYEPILPDQNGRLVSRLGLAVTRWEGKFNGVTATWLRWATLEGSLLPTNEEAKQQSDILAEQADKRAKQADVHAKQANARAEQEHARAEQFAEQLRALGIDPNTL